MKRFLLFAYDSHYPAGGWGDFMGSFDTLDEARAAYSKPERRPDWCQVVDGQTGEIAFWD